MKSLKVAREASTSGAFLQEVEALLFRTKEFDFDPTLGGIVGGCEDRPTPTQHHLRGDRWATGGVWSPPAQESARGRRVPKVET